MGENGKATEIYEKVYSLRKEILGETHLETLNSLKSLISCYKDSGNDKKAVELQEMLTSIQSKKHNSKK